MNYNLFFIFLFYFFSGKLLVVLRDGRTLIGELMSVDQFGKSAPSSASFQ